MAEKYCDPNAGGADDGSTKINAWQTLQKAADTATAGDTVLCRHTDTPDETLAATIDFDTNAGTGTSRINFVGVNTSWVEDGTQYVLDANSSALRCIYINAKSYITMKNFECMNTTGDGVQGTATSVGVVLENLYIHDCAVYCLDIYGLAESLVIRCRMNDSLRGWNRTGGYYHIACEMIGNSQQGCASIKADTLIGCIIADNTLEGLDQYGGGHFDMQCVWDNNGGPGGIDVRQNSSFGWSFSGRFTNNTGFGIAQNTNTGWIENYNIFYGNNGELGGSVLPGLQSRGDEAEHVFDDVTQDGYVDDGNDDYNIAEGQLYRILEWTLPRNYVP